MSWLTIFIVVSCFWFQGKRRQEQSYVDQDQRLAIIKRLRKIEEKIDSIEGGLTELRSRVK